MTCNNDLESQATQVPDHVLRKAARKVKLRLLPIFVFIVFTSYLDRGNISYAARALKTELKLDDLGYGAVAGSLFYTYVLFQWPHTKIAQWAGLRSWLSLNVILWGICSLLVSTVSEAWQLVSLRLVVGFAEAASFPLIYAHLDSFLPDTEVAFCWSVVVATSQAASILSGPIAAGLTSLPTGVVVSHPWQWLFVVEGSTALVAGIVTYCCLVDSLDSVKALTEEERAALRKAKVAHVEHNAAGVSDWKAWYIGVINLFIATPVYAFMFFSPMLIHTLLGPNSSDALVDVLNGVPYVCATVLMLLFGFTIRRSSDRLYHGIIGTTLAAILAFTFPAVDSYGSAQASFVHLSILYGINAALFIPVDTMPSAYCAESAGSYAIVNSVKSISGIVGPAVFGAVKQAVGGTSAVGVLGIFQVLALTSLVLFFVLIGDAKGAFLCRGTRSARSLHVVEGNVVEGSGGGGEPLRSAAERAAEELEGHIVAEA